MNQSIATLAAGALLGMLSACSPIQHFHHRERVITGPPRPAIHVDRFSYGRAMGAVDVVFAVDNTESVLAVADSFEQSYRAFLAQFNLPEARLLDYRVQVVANPSGNSPQNWAAREKGSAAHLAEAFIGGAGTPPVLSRGERGYLSAMPLARVMSTDAFKDRGRVPLFAVYLLGADSAPTIDSFRLDPSQAPEDLAKLFDSTRGAYQTHLMTLARTATIPSPHFPRCDRLDPPVHLAPSLSSYFRPELRKTVDLCDPNWAQAYVTTLFDSIIAFKKRMILSRVPYQVETMVLRRGDNHLYRYGEDYRYDAKSGELVFLHDPGLLEGDLLDASYNLEPVAEVLPNGHTPDVGT